MSAGDMRNMSNITEAPRAAPLCDPDLSSAASPATRRVRLQARLWAWQRISAMVLALCVVGHLAGMIYAVRGGLSAAEILGRTHGNWAFGLFYATFVLACTVHVPIGLARILEETFSVGTTASAVIAKLFAIALLILGLRAVFAVVIA